MAAPLAPAAIAALQRALALLKAGDGTGAAAVLTALPPAVRGHPDALTVAAMVHKAQGQLETARGLFEAATRAAPGHPGIWNSYANLLDELAEHDAAIAAYRRSVAIEPRAASVWTNLALAAISAEQWDTAAVALDRALALVPADPRALAARGLVEAGRGALDAAVAAHRRALVANPGDALTRHNLAVALRRLDRAEDALEALGTAARPDSAALRGHLLADLGAFDAALAQYRAVLATDPGHLVTLDAIAELLPQLDRPAEALDGYRAALATAASPALWRAAITTAKGHGDVETQLGWARAAQAAHGRQLDWQLAEAGALSALGQGDAALALAEAAAAAHPQAGGAQNYLAWLLLKGGDPARAERHAARATELAPRDQSPWALLTLIWRLIGDGREAWLADYDRLVIAAEIETPRGWPALPAFLADLAETLGRRHQTLRAPADQSLRGGTQTRGKLFETSDRVLVALRGALVATVERGLAGLALDPTHPFLGRLTRGVGMAGSWSVRLRGQGFHISHIHPQGWLSSAFYVEVPAEIGGDADAGKLLFGMPDASLGLDLPPRRMVTPVPGRLAIFPSYMWHGTAPFESAAARLTVAFDAVPKA